MLESLTLRPSCSLPIVVRVLSVVMRLSRPIVRPIVLPVALPTVPRVVSFDSRKLVVLLEPIVLPIREGNLSSDERCLVAACFFETDIDGSLLPITLPILRLRSERIVERLLLTLGGVEGLGELAAGCRAPVGAEELRAPIVLPMRERWLVVGCFFVFETDGVLRLLESSIREAPLERAAGCFAPLGTDGLVALILLPIREVMLGLILLLVLLVERFVITLLEPLKFKLLLLELLTLDVPLLELLLFVIALLELLLLDGVLVVIMLPIRDVMLGLILLFELFRLPEFRVDVRELIDLLGVLLVVLRFVITLLELLLGDLLVMALLELLLLGVRFVMTRLDVLLLGARLVILLLELLLLLGALLVILLLLELLLLLGALLVTLLLELRLDETLLERLDDERLDVDLDAEDDLEGCRLELLDRLLDRDLAAITGSQNNKSTNSMQKTRKSELSRNDLEILTFEF